MNDYAKTAFTPSVKAFQARMGSRRAYQRQEALGSGAPGLGEDEALFLAERDSFYLATVSETGWPYLQHRGGTKGFVRVLDERTLCFADYRGNRQYVSAGNLTRDDRVALLFMDYPHRTRLKILGRATVGDPPRANPGEPPAERLITIRVEGFDWNCPQHITPRFTEDELREALAPMVRRLEGLERENASLDAEPVSSGSRGGKTAGAR